jgi:hypothetical protein
MNFNVLNKINKAKSIIKEIRDDLNYTKTTEKDKQIQTSLLEKQKHDEQNKEYKSQKYLSEPNNSIEDLNFNDLFNLNKIKNNMLNEKIKFIENTKNEEKKV